MEDTITKDSNIKSNKKYFARSPPKKKTLRRVLVFGTYDIIHPAHLEFLIEARKVVNCPECELVVVVARDSSIKIIKGRRPIFTEEERLQLIRSLRIVDYARLGNEGENRFNIILELEPDYIVLGYDQLLNETPLHDFIEHHKLQTEIQRLPKYESGDLSSSSEVRKKVLRLMNEEKNNAKEHHSP